MSTSTFGFHVAIIMDGNGRWAKARGRPRRFGHAAGARAVRRVVEAAPAYGITTLTLYAFSSDNWRRPRSEVDHLMRLFTRHLRSERDRLVAHGVRLSIIGRRDRISDLLRQGIEDVERHTAEGTSLHLRIALDYSARQALLEAALSLAATTKTNDIGDPRAGFEAALSRAMHADAAPDVDLLIRTGGEQRLSDFLLWESAYAELLFMNVMWPDFGNEHLASAVQAFASRERRFGRVSPPPTEAKGRLRTARAIP